MRGRMVMPERTPHPVSDNFVITFGMHKGKKLIDVPASYLLHFYSEKYDWLKNNHPRVCDYIRQNEDALLEEVDGDW